MKQSIEERKQHHQTREDRQRNALAYLEYKIERAIHRPSTVNRERAYYEQEAARLRAKLNIS